MYSSTCVIHIMYNEMSSFTSTISVVYTVFVGVDIDLIDYVVYKTYGVHRSITTIHINVDYRRGKVSYTIYSYI